MKKIISMLSHPIRIKSFYILLFISIFLEYTDLKNMPLWHSILNLIICIISIPFSFWLLMNIRGLKLKNGSEIGVWGYVWRYLVVFLSSSLPVAVTFYSGFDIKLINEGLLINIFADVLILSFMPVFTWLIFSKDRKSQFKYMISFVSLFKF